MQSQLGKLQELTEGVTIGTDGGGAGLTLLPQTLHEEMFQQYSEVGGGGHCRSSQHFSSRPIASRISSGAALKYHCVSATCPSSATFSKVDLATEEDRSRG